ncbi:MAG: ribosome silencing factor [Christensenellaceae bacterium]|jgi:ribosome-associated protein|nr:ribosome silencing factor [Christensenellaceae bacterium]
MELSNKVMMVCKALDDKKAMDISIINISKNSSIADDFVLTTASSITHARTLSDVVCEVADVIGEKVFGIDGHGQANWISLDLGDVIVHIFTKEVRDHYSLEKMWADSKNHKKFTDIKKDIEKKDAKAAEKTSDDKKKKETKKEVKPAADKKKTKEVKENAKAPKKTVKETVKIEKISKKAVSKAKPKEDKKETKTKIEKSAKK